MTEKARRTSGRKSWCKRDRGHAGKSACRNPKARSGWKAQASTEDAEAGFQEKLLAYSMSARTENGHTWVRRES